MATFSFQGKDIYYETHGEGKPLLFLNGIMMNCASWAAFIESFSANNQLILVDMLDQGRSGKMEEPFTQALQVEVIYALLSHLGLEKVSIMGISYGGEVAMQFAIKYQDKIDRLILSNTTARTSPWLKDIGDAWNKAAIDGEAYYLTTIPVIYSPEFYTKNIAWMNQRRELLIPVFSTPAFIESMVRLTNSAANMDVRDKIHTIKVPTLVISSEQDFITPLAEQQFIVSQIEGADHIIIPGCGHASMYEKPMLFASLVLGYINNTVAKYHIA